MYKSLKDSNFKLYAFVASADAGGAGASSGGDYDFGTDTSVIDDLITALDEAITKLGTEGSGGLLDKIYSDIYGLEGEDSWQGESYNIFKDKCDSYKEAIYAVVDLLKAFKSKVEKMEPVSEQLITDVSDTLNIS